MVRQHDAPCPDPDRPCATGDVRDDDGRCRTRDPLHIVMLRDPEALVAPLLGVGGEIAPLMNQALGELQRNAPAGFQQGQGGRVADLQQQGLGTGMASEQAAELNGQGTG